MRLGLLLGFEETLNDVLTVARQAEEAGAHSVHLVEAGRSAFVTASAVAATTERVMVGTYVVNAYARSPWLTGIAARDLDELSGGRFVLGVGTGNLHFNEWYQGLDSSRPMAKMRDYIEIVKAIVEAKAGEGVRHSGPVHQARWRASFEPARPTIPVYLSASGPNMRRLAAEVSDGIGVGIMASPEFMAETVRPEAMAAASAVGRDPSALGFPMGAWVSVNADPELARQAAKMAVCGLFHPVPHPYYDSQLRQQGFADVADMAAELVPAGRTREAMDLVPDEVVETMTITGTPAECAERLEAYEGLADEVVAFRVPQRDDAKGTAAYEDLLEVVALAAAG